MKVLLAILLTILFALQIRLWTGDGSVAHVVRLQREVAAQQEENIALEARNRLLAAQVEAFKEGTSGVEERARHQMGMIREGETFFMIVDKRP